MLYSPKLFYTVIFILLLAPVVTLLTAENSDSAVVLFTKKQVGVSSVISANVDSYCDLGNYAFLAIVVGLSEQEEALEITGSEADGFTLISRTPAIAGMILMIDEGIEFDRSLFDVKLK